MCGNRAGQLTKRNGSVTMRSRLPVAGRRDALPDRQPPLAPRRGGVDAEQVHAAAGEGITVVLSSALPAMPMLAMFPPEFPQAALSSEHVDSQIVDWAAREAGVSRVRSRARGPGGRAPARRSLQVTAPRPPCRSPHDPLSARRDHVDRDSPTPPDAPVTSIARPWGTGPFCSRRWMASAAVNPACRAPWR